MLIFVTLYEQSQGDTQSRGRLLQQHHQRPSYPRSTCRIGCSCLLRPRKFACTFKIKSIQKLLINYFYDNFSKKYSLKDKYPYSHTCPWRRSWAPEWGNTGWHWPCYLSRKPRNLVLLEFGRSSQSCLFSKKHIINSSVINLYTFTHSKYLWLPQYQRLSVQLSIIITKVPTCICDPLNAVGGH